MAQKQQLVNILSKAAPQMDGQREAIKKLWTHRWRKGKKMIDEHLKLFII